MHKNFVLIQILKAICYFRYLRKLHVVDDYSSCGAQSHCLQTYINGAFGPLVQLINALLIGYPIVPTVMKAL